MHLLIFDLNLSSMSPLLLAATLSFMVVAVFPYEVQIPLTGSSSTTVVSSCPLSLITCLTVNSVPVKRTSDPDWNAYASTYNARLQYKPAVVVLPSTAQHVSDAVRCAAKDGVKVQAKSGGHSYASFSTGGQDGSMVILLENFQDVDVREDGVARVGAGTRLGNLGLAIYEQGKRALTHGLCKSVGVGGHFLHGGFGHWSRAWGLALDQIVGLDVVLANGSLVRASERTYPEVYYVSLRCFWNAGPCLLNRTGHAWCRRLVWYCYQPIPSDTACSRNSNLMEVRIRRLPVKRFQRHGCHEAHPKLCTERVRYRQ